MTLQELLTQIRQEQGSFSAAQRLVAAYMLEHYHQVPFLSISALADTIGVSDNTVVKFCNQLGFPRFAEFKKFISDYIAQSTDPELVMSKKLSNAREDGLFAQTMEEDISAIRATLSDSMNQQALPKLLEMMERAKHIYVAGARSSANLAELFVTQLRYLSYRVHGLNLGASDYLDCISAISADDLVIALTFPRYTSQTIQGLRDLHERGVPVAVITDTGLSPAICCAEVAFTCSVASGSYFPCLSGCLSLMNGICHAAAASRRAQATKHIRQLEGKLLERHVFLD